MANGKNDGNGKNCLYYGDNLEILRMKVKDETVDLCYIDPPFNSKRTYNQIYNNVGAEDVAQEQAFIDTWTWDQRAEAGHAEIISNGTGRYTAHTIDLIKGLESVLGRGALLAYLVSMTQRVVEIHRTLKPSGSFYLHCDPTASHYLKLVLDTVFGAQQFRNEIIWHYSGWNKKLRSGFESRHDVLMFYAKEKNTFNSYAVPWGSVEEYVKVRKQKVRMDENDRPYVLSDAGGGKRVRRYLDEAIAAGSPVDDVWDIDKLNNSSKERLGWATQKPEALMERVIRASSSEGDVVMDPFCGCGTTVAVAQRLGRRWIGVDISYQAVSLILKRLEDTFGTRVAEAVMLDGIPRDLASALALAHKRDDRVRKEFEKWAVLTYTNNRAAINSKRGADGGLDGVAYFWKTKTDTDKAAFQVKSGSVGRGDIAKLRTDMETAGAVVATLITLEEPTQPMRVEAKRAGTYLEAFTGQNRDRIEIVTVREILEEGYRLTLPLTAAVLKTAAAEVPEYQPTLQQLPQRVSKAQIAKVEHPVAKGRRRRRA